MNQYLPTLLRKITYNNIISELRVSSYVFSRIYANIATCNPIPFLWVHVVEIFNIAKFAKFSSAALARDLLLQAELANIAQNYLSKLTPQNVRSHSVTSVRSVTHVLSVWKKNRRKNPKKTYQN